MRRSLAAWYGRAKRDLPWRRTSDPYPIWISEVMLQQTRVAAVIPYYHRFLELFPTVERLAQAPEQQLLAAWSGLGYYSRARNLQKAAQQIANLGHFPKSLEGLRALAGIGDYTAAAIASISFGLPHAVLDGNVMRVLTRLTADPSDIGAPKTRARLAEVAQEFLDTRAPATHNQAVMELGAMVCLPRDPQCGECPLAAHCEARTLGRTREFPVKARKTKKVLVELNLFVIEREGRLLLWKRGSDAGRMRDFWELPPLEQFGTLQPGKPLGSFRHTITHHFHTVHVFRAQPAEVGFLPGLDAAPAEFQWARQVDLATIPLSTITKKALAIAERKIR